MFNKEPCDSWVIGNTRLDQDTRNIENGRLFQYNRSAIIYRCPTDRSHVTRLKNLLRTRSYALSTGIAHENKQKSLKYVRTFADLTEPMPVKASVFLDEDAYSIQNGALGIEPLAHYYWNLPASRHDNGGAITFADGHAEVWHWKDKFIPAGSAELKRRYDANPFNSNVTAPSSSGDKDLMRLQETVPPRPR